MNLFLACFRKAAERPCQNMKHAWPVMFDVTTSVSSLMHSFKRCPCKSIVGEGKRKEGRLAPCGLDINTGSCWGKGILLECRKDAVTQALLLHAFGSPHVSLLSYAALVGDTETLADLCIDEGLLCTIRA